MRSVRRRMTTRMFNASLVVLLFSLAWRGPARRDDKHNRHAERPRANRDHG